MAKPPAEEVTVICSPWLSSVTTWEGALWRLKSTSEAPIRTATISVAAIVLSTRIRRVRRGLSAGTRVGGKSAPPSSASSLSSRFIHPPWFWIISHLVYRMSRQNVAPLATFFSLTLEYELHISD